LSDSVIFKFGADTNSVSRALRGLNGEVADFRNKSLESFKTIQNGIKWFGRANMLLGLIGQLDQMMAKAKELGQWWGAYSVGGVKAVNAIGAAEREAERNRQKFRALNEKRWKEEADAAKAQIEHAKVMRDIVFKNATDEGKLNILAKERNELFRKFTQAQAGSAEFYKSQADYLKKEQEIREQNLAIEKKKTEEAEKQTKLSAQIAAQKQEIERIKNKAGDRSRVTLDELVSDQTSGTLGQDKQKAQRARDLEAQADEARLRGDFKGSENLLNQRDAIVTGDNSSKESVAMRARIERMRRETATRSNPEGNKMAIAEMEAKYQEQFGGIGSLKSSEKELYTETKRALDDANAQLLELIAQQGGLPVKPKMGK
jgi:hypothetical protein